MTARHPEAGVTLIEMMVALALFALIGSAGFAMLDQVLRTQRGTEGRLQRLSQDQRALLVIQSDALMALPHSLRASDALASESLAFDRSGLHLRYHLTDGVLRRDVTGTGGQRSDQALLAGVDSVQWRFLAPSGSWVEAWPEDPTLTTPANPRAVEWVIGLGDLGQIRRVTPLPADLQ